MGLDPTMLLGLMGNMGNMAQGGMNTALSAIPTGISLLDRMRLRRDPILNLLNMRDLGQGYRAITQNPYGDPWGGWGGSFGTDASGKPVGFGEANVRAVMDMMGRTPGASTVSNYQTLAGQQRPGTVDTTAGMNALLGLPPSGLGNGQSPMFVPKSATDKGGGGGGSTIPNPPKVAAGAQGGGLPDFGAMPPINLTVNRGGPGQGILGRLMGNAFASRGGMPALMSQLRGPGNALNDMGDFWREGARPAGPDPNAAFWATHGNPGGKAIPPMPPQYDWLQNAQPRKGMPSYAVGTSYVPKTGVAMLHQGEAVIPRRLNPMAQQGGMSGGYNPNSGVPVRGQSMIGGGRQSGGMSGGASPAPQMPHSLMQDVIANPMSLTPAIQQQIINRGTDSLTNNYGQMARGAWDRSGALGGVGAAPNLAALNFGLAGGVSDINRDVGIEAARTNFGDLMNAANMQWGATRDTAQQGLQQQYLDQNAFQNDRDFMARLIESMHNTQQGDIGNQLSLWDRINGLGQGGINFPNTFLDRLRGGRSNQLVPNSIQMPTGGGQAQNPFDLSSWQQLTSWGGS